MAIYRPRMLFEIALVPGNPQVRSSSSNMSKIVGPESMCIGGEVSRFPDR